MAGRGGRPSVSEEDTAEEGALDGMGNENADTEGEEEETDADKDGDGNNVTAFDDDDDDVDDVDDVEEEEDEADAEEDDDEDDEDDDGAVCALRRGEVKLGPPLLPELNRKQTHASKNEYKTC